MCNFCLKQGQFLGASAANLYPNLLNCYMLPLNGIIRKSVCTFIGVFRRDLPAVPPEWPMFLCRVMLLVVLCLVDMVGDQSNPLINRMPQQHHTKAIISQWVDSNSRVHVNLKCSSLLNVHRIRGILLFVRGSMRLSGNVNWQMVRNISIKVTRSSFFGGVPSYFEALWFPHLYFYRKSNT